MSSRAGAKRSCSIGAVRCHVARVPLACIPARCICRFGGGCVARLLFLIPECLGCACRSAVQADWFRRRLGVVQAPGAGGGLVDRAQRSAGVTSIMLWGTVVCVGVCRRPGSLMVVVRCSFSWYCFCCCCCCAAMVLQWRRPSLLRRCPKQTTMPRLHLFYSPALLGPSNVPPLGVPCGFVHCVCPSSPTLQTSWPHHISNVAWRLASPI